MFWFSLIKHRHTAANVYPARFEMAWVGLGSRNQRWHFLVTLALNRVDAAREEGAAFRRVAHVGRRTFNLRQFFIGLAHVVARQRLEQAERIRVARIFKYVDDRAALDDSAAVHHLHIV